MRLPKFLGSISTSVGVLFLKIRVHTWHSTYILNNECCVSVLLITKALYVKRVVFSRLYLSLDGRNFPPPKKKNLTLHTHSLENL